MINFANDFTLFNKENLGSVRTLIDDTGAIWFIATDVCNILEIKNTSDALARLETEEKMTIATTDSHSGQRGGAQSMNIINESGLYTLVLTSRKPQAKEFKSWLTKEVIPSIRQNGGYIYNQEKLSKKEQEVIKDELQDMSEMIQKLRKRRKDLLHNVKDLKAKKQHLQKEQKCLNEYTDIYEDMFFKAQQDYIKAEEQNSILFQILRREKNEIEPSKPKIFITHDGLIVTPEMQTLLNNEPERD